MRQRMRSAAASKSGASGRAQSVLMGDGLSGEIAMGFGVAYTTQGRAMGAGSAPPPAADIGVHLFVSVL